MTLQQNLLKEMYVEACCWVETALLLEACHHATDAIGSLQLA